MVDKSISYMFRKFDPIRRMIISRDSGMLNDYFSITKGQLIDLNFFCTMGKKDNDEEQTYPVESKGEVKYVPKNQVNRYKSGILEISTERMIENATYVED